MQRGRRNARFHPHGRSQSVRQPRQPLRNPGHESRKLAQPRRVSLSVPEKHELPASHSRRAVPAGRPGLHGAVLADLPRTLHHAGGHRLHRLDGRHDDPATVPLQALHQRGVPRIAGSGNGFRTGGSSRCMVPRSRAAPDSRHARLSGRTDRRQHRRFIRLSLAVPQSGDAGALHRRMAEHCGPLCRRTRDSGVR